MTFQTNIYANKYTSADWTILEEAYKLALEQIGSNPDVQRDRLAGFIMTFFDRGVHSVSIVSSLAMNREMSLVDAARARRSPADNNDIISSDEALYYDWKTLEWNDSTTN
ncbi:hypothetical protein V9K92_00895 [Phyllobacterium sp. CCNWLW109]|uniref:hypothetical protein n=1 Tax=Phyllobacterium sp. CCNWLW109 TaxID=3127479 RepID=UPI0030778399